MSAAVSHRYGFDELRRFAAALGTAAGLAPPRSLALASHLLWFDAAGAPTLGIATLPNWLDGIERGDVDPRATGRVISERTALAVFDGENGLPPLVLERAGEVAVEKAREAAAGLVRVVGVGPVPSAAPVAATIATGPTAGWVLGPDRRWSMALPSRGGLPLVVDSGLSADHSGPVPVSGLLEGFWLGIEALIAEGGWLVAAVSLPALAAPAADPERWAAGSRGMAPGPGRLLPDAWESRRRSVRQSGVAIEPASWKSLAHWARRLSVEAPDPLASRKAVDRS